MVQWTYIIHALLEGVSTEQRVAPQAAFQYCYGCPLQAHLLPLQAPFSASTELRLQVHMLQKHTQTWS